METGLTEVIRITLQLDSVEKKALRSFVEAITSEQGLPGLSIQIEADEDQFMACCLELDLVAAMDTPEEAREDLIKMMREYAEEYIENAGLYLESINKAHQLPYILTILSCRSDEELKKALVE